MSDETLRARVRRVTAYALGKRDQWAKHDSEAATARAIAYQHIAGELIKALDSAEDESDLIGLLAAQRDWSRETFGPGDRLQGILEHIRKELVEVEAAPRDVTEWIDVVILAFDGAWRSGASPDEIVEALKAKYAKNRARTWPDWRTALEGQAIEHVRGDS